MNGNRYRQLSKFGVALAIVGAVVGYMLVSLWLGSADCSTSRFSPSCAFWADSIGTRLQGFLSIVGGSVAATPGILLFLCAAMRADDNAGETVPADEAL